MLLMEREENDLQRDKGRQVKKWMRCMDDSSHCFSLLTRNKIYIKKSSSYELTITTLNHIIFYGLTHIIILFHLKKAKSKTNVCSLLRGKKKETRSKPCINWQEKILWTGIIVNSSVHTYYMYPYIQQRKKNKKLKQIPVNKKERRARSLFVRKLFFQRNIVEHIWHHKIVGWDITHIGGVSLVPTISFSIICIYGCI